MEGGLFLITIKLNHTMYFLIGTIGIKVLVGALVYPNMLELTQGQTLILHQATGHLEMHILEENILT
jgi:hypothetical protein